MQTITPRDLAYELFFPALVGGYMFSRPWLPITFSESFKMWNINSEGGKDQIHVCVVKLHPNRNRAA